MLEAAFQLGGCIEDSLVQERRRQHLEEDL